MIDRRRIISLAGSLRIQLEKNQVLRYVKGSLRCDYDAGLSISIPFFLI